MTRVVALVVALGGCGGAPGPHAPQSRPGPRLVVGNVLDVQVNALPITNLHWSPEPGDTSKVGGYRIGPCVLAFIQGAHQTGLEPGSVVEPENYRYRSKPLGTDPARWATWKGPGTGEQPGPYWVGVYVPGLQITVGCETAELRDRAIAMLETTQVTQTRLQDDSGVDPAHGPAEWSEPAPLCTVTHAPPVAGTGEAVIVVTAANPEVALVATFTSRNADGAATTSMTATDVRGGSIEFRTEPGRFVVGAMDGHTPVNCGAVEAVAGGRTTVRVERFHL